MKQHALAEHLLGYAKKNGAHQADVLLVGAESSSASCRHGALEESEFSESFEVGLRVLIDQRQALVSTSDLSDDSLKRMSEKACAMAKLMPQDPFVTFPNKENLPSSEKLDLIDSSLMTPEQLLARAEECEAIGREQKGITNSEGASASFSKIDILYANSLGFSGAYGRTSHSLSLALLSGKEETMQQDYDYTYATHLEDLRTAKEVADRAAQRTLSKLNPQKVKSCQVPVIYDPRVASTLLGHLAGAISGAAIAKGMSFLKDKLGQPLFPSAITVTDDPLRKRGHKSHPFDAEGNSVQKTFFVEKGMLTTWMLDCRSANQLGLKSTGHASRGPSSLPNPAPSNLYFEKGHLSPKDLMGDIKDGFYVTELMGQGVNPVTGDYSRGASGFWIKDGKIDFPVSEITIAGNLIDMFKELSVANDLLFESALNAPTIRIDKMMIAGR